MKIFIPDINEKTIYDIDYEKLKKTGITCLAFDLDQTLTDSHSMDVLDKQRNLIKKLKDMGFDVIIVSNNLHRRRVMHWGNELGVEAIHAAWKPRKSSFKKVLIKYKIPAKQLAFIGDQIFTDVWGSNKVGALSILVNPVDKKDEIFTLPFRIIERIIIKRVKEKYGVEIRKY